MGQGMRQTRRQFVGTAAALAALSLASARAASAGPVRMSLAAFCADPARVASLRKGVAAMKALPGSDHRSWFFQAATHAYSPTLLAAELRRDPHLRKFDKAKYWNKCPHFGQSSADFAIWHRAFLHFFERALRAAAQDPALALPYWDYGQEDQRVFPAIYVPDFLDDAKKNPNPLFHPNREKAFTKGLLEISAEIGQAPKTVGAATYFHAVGVPGFGGDTLSEDHTQVGLLEQRPHNDIHLAVGGVINSSNGAMAEITTAAFDPVFWVHHANIDRMWAAWAATPGKTWGPAPSPDWFDERPWTFVDADGSEVTVSRREAAQMLAVYDVDYPNQLAVPAAEVKPPQALPGAAPPVAAMPPMVGAAPPRRHARQPRAPLERELLADSQPMVVTPHNAGRRLFGTQTAGGAASYATESATPTLNAPELADGTSRVLLELTGIGFKLVPSSGFAVYLDCAGQAPSTDPVGLIDIFGATHHGAGMDTMPGMAAVKASQRFDVTAIVRKSRGPFALRIEPYDLLVARDGSAPRSRADAVTIAAVRFLVIA